MKHELKILPKYYNDVVTGAKNFELRKNDRNFQVGDILVLKEWSGDYTGNEIEAEVKYILQDCPEYGLDEGYCIMSLNVLSGEF